jgi:hypothetical protein
MSDTQEHLRSLLHSHQRRLQELEKTAAVYGNDSPTHIKIELEDLRQEIRRLQANLSNSGSVNEGIFVVETLHQDQVIQPQDLPLTIEGRYADKDLVYVWVVLQDTYKHFYLQNPPVTFQPNGRWIATNVLPGVGIERIHFVRVDESGHAHFLRKIHNADFGGFDKLPPHSTILQSIHILRT